MLSDKTWFLDYVQTINGTTIKTKTYLGQATPEKKEVKSSGNVDNLSPANLFKLKPAGQ